MSQNFLTKSFLKFHLFQIIIWPSFFLFSVIILEHHSISWMFFGDLLLTLRSFSKPRVYSFAIGKQTKDYCCLVILIIKLCYDMMKHIEYKNLCSERKVEFGRAVLFIYKSLNHFPYSGMQLTIPPLVWISETMMKKN